MSIPVELFEVDTPVKRKFNQTEKRANDLNGKKWLQYSISVWDDIYKTPEEMSLRHPAMFPSMLAQRIIEMLTSKNQKVILDPFLGSGSTLVACKRLDTIHLIKYGVSDQKNQLKASL